MSWISKALKRDPVETAPTASGGAKSPVTARAQKFGRAKLPQRTSAPGSRVLKEGFFDAHPNFLSSSETSATPDRLNMRYAAIFEENAEMLAGRRVLDISSHDGRWSFAAIAAGASSVIGVEARPELVEASNRTFESEGIAKERYEFIAGDVFDVLGSRRLEVDVVLCLGFLYHTLRYNELFKRIRDLDPSHLIVDTEVLPGRSKALVQILNENTERQGNAVADDFSYGDKVLVGVPSVPALRVLGRAYGFELEQRSDWTGLLADNPDAADVGDYRSSNRTTVRFQSV